MTALNGDDIEQGKQYEIFIGAPRKKTDRTHTDYEKIVLNASGSDRKDNFEVFGLKPDLHDFGKDI